MVSGLALQHSYVSSLRSDAAQCPLSLDIVAQQLGLPNTARCRNMVRPYSHRCTIPLQYCLAVLFTFFCYKRIVHCMFICSLLSSHIPCHCSPTHTHNHTFTHRSIPTSRKHTQAQSSNLTHTYTTPHKHTSPHPHLTSSDIMSASNSKFTSHSLTCTSPSPAHHPHLHITPTCTSPSPARHSYVHDSHLDTPLSPTYSPFFASLANMHRPRQQRQCQQQHQEDHQEA
jgi:hypothetical protein